MTARGQSGLINGSIGFASRATIQGCLFFVTIVATHYLSIADFGRYSLAASLVIFSRNLFYTGPYEYLLKSRDGDTDKASCFWANWALAGSTGLCMAMFGVVSRVFIGANTIAPLLAMFIPCLFLSATSAWYEALLLRQRRVGRYYASTIFAEVASAILAVVLLTRQFGVLSLIAQIYTRILILMTIFGASVGERPPLRLRIEGIAAVLRWSWSRYASVGLNFLSNYGADYILGIFWSPVATGIYRASNRIVSAVTDLFAQPLQKIVQTNLSSRAARGLPPDSSWLDMFSAVGFFGWSVLAGLALVARELTPMVLGAKWSAAAPIVSIFCVARALSLLDMTTVAQLVCYDRPRLVLTVQTVVAAIILIGSWAIVPWGTTAVAILVTTVLCGMSFAYLFLAIRMSHTTPAALAGAFRTVLFPVILIALCVTLARHLPITITGSPLVEIALLAVAGGMGCVIAGLMMRGAMLNAIGQLNHERY